MKVYIVIIAAILALSSYITRQDRAAVLLNLDEKKEKRDRLLIQIIALILIFFAGFRYQVGSDYWQYSVSYYGYYLSDLELFDEPGIKIVAKLAHLIYDDYATMFVIMSVITVGSVLYRLAKDSPFWMVSVLLYIFLGGWHAAFNAVRQCAAAAILFCGHPFIRKRKLLSWTIIVLMASLFHISAIVFVCLYWIPTKKLTTKKIILFFCVGVMLAFSYDTVWELVGFMKQEEFNLTIYATSHVSFFRIIVSWVPTIFYFLVVKKHVEDEDRSAMNFYANYSLVGATIMLAARYSTYLARTAIYMQLYNTVFWAYMIKDLFIHQKSVRDKRIWMFVILGCYFIYYLFEAKGPYLVDYKTIFSR